MNATDFECPVRGAKVGERCPFTGKTSPVTDAKRKWAAVGNLATDDEEEVTHPERGKEPATSQRGRNLTVLSRVSQRSSTLGKDVRIEIFNSDAKKGLQR